MSKLHDAALDYAAHGKPVFPCAGKEPLTAHGFKDASRDPQRIDYWWGRHPDANIGLEIPDDRFVIDIDPQNGGLATLHDIARRTGEALPLKTPITITGQGGRHLWYQHPGGPLVNTLGPGIDIKAPGKGYVIAPPSVHPDTGVIYEEGHGPNQGLDGEPARLRTRWRLLLHKFTAPVIEPRYAHKHVNPDDETPGDWYNRTAAWSDIIGPHGWVLVRVHHNNIGQWRRPGKDDGISATTNALGTDRLHVFTSNGAPFEPNKGYSKFGAYTVLNHHHDFKAAARALAELREQAGT